MDLATFKNPFQIGLGLLSLKHWLHVDEGLEFYLAEKARLHAAHEDLVFAEEADTQEAQREVLALIVAHLCEHYPEIYARNETGVSVRGRHITYQAKAPLWVAAQLVQEDLILMRKGPDGWRLAAASLSFPSSWSLREKFTHPLHHIHKPVPGFGTGTRTATLIERIFDNLQVEQPVERRNWSLYADDALYHPAIAIERPDRFNEAEIAENPFIRQERQTLRKLPQSGDILFTVRIYIERAAQLRTRAEGPDAITAINAQLARMSEAELTYKGIPPGFSL